MSILVKYIKAFILGSFSAQRLPWPDIRASRSGQALRGVALVRADGFSIVELIISISRINDLLPIGDGKSGEPVAGAELSAPARTLL